jgi:hypothetical protein
MQIGRLRSCRSRPIVVVVGDIRREDDSLPLCLDRERYAWNELPQPQDFTAFGLSNVKPRRSMPS